MSQKSRFDSVDPLDSRVGSLSEPESYIEHQAALDATVFQPDRDARELVLELEAGELRVRRRGR